MPITRIEIDFALPVELEDAHYRAFDKILGDICDKNCPEGWVFWPAGQGSKPHFSQADSEFLGKEIEPNAPATGEPTWDDSIFYVECAAREAYPEEVERKRARAQQAEERKRRLLVRLAHWLHVHGYKRLSWLVADLDFLKDRFVRRFTG